LQHHVLNADVLRLLDQAACAHPDVDPTRFDAHYWSERARETVATYCHKCPAIASCATVILGPAKHASFTGIASGLVWRAGKPVRQPLKRRRKKQ
jgi:hypothetical protein